MNPRGYYARDLDYRPLEPAEEVQLFDKVIRGNKPKAHWQHRRIARLAERQIVEAYLLFAAKIGRQVIGGLKYVDDVDIISIANDALLRAVRRFNPRLKARFFTFCTPFIRGSVTAYLQRVYVRRSKETTMPEAGEEGSDPALRVTPMENIEHRDQVREFKRLLWQAEEVLNDQEWLVVRTMLENDLNMSKVAVKIHRTRERVRQIFEEAACKLRLRLKAIGVDCLPE